ncbi:electron transport complex subunit RsxE [Tissierella creatinophila]|uniref:Ion-translocating oxidoreductase complex subunit E n=1 Tax=Tissierella creatinophila DSM 6911 TaxID=1123403 RepID=A0A1U7M7Q5_TISCR|nr:electron transport complex subunit E [Tissierella creatinophila]OLS03316.1 electron transport complex subunit RsxE [Tissierella creatinophila DSM 6911]
MKLTEIFKNGILKDNPVLVQLVGLCSVLAVTNTVLNAASMALAVIAVLVCSNVVVSLLRKVIPKKIRIPAFIVIIATFVTIVEMLMKAFAQPIYQSLGIFIPLIVVNCVILARAESFAYKNKVFISAMDGLAMGLGYGVAVILLAFIRETIGAGTLFAGTDFVINVFGKGYQPIAMFVGPSGAFIVLGILVAVFKNIIKKSEEKAIN